MSDTRDVEPSGSPGHTVTNVAYEFHTRPHKSQSRRFRTLYLLYMTSWFGVFRAWAQRFKFFLWDRVVRAFIWQCQDTWGGGGGVVVVIVWSFELQLVEQELLTLPEHLRSPPVFSGFRVTQSLVLYVCFVDRCLSFCAFSFDHCVVCSSIYGFWLPLWYLQALLTTTSAISAYHH